MTTLSYTPRGDRVIVEQAELPEAPAEGLVTPKSQQKPLNEGTVIALGPKVEGIQVGQQVCFLEYAGSPITIDGKEYLSMRDEEIHGVRETVNPLVRDWISKPSQPVCKEAPFRVNAAPPTGPSFDPHV